MVDLVCYPSNVLYFEIAFLYYYVDARSSIIFFISSGEVCLSVGILYERSDQENSEHGHFKRSVLLK